MKGFILAFQSPLHRGNALRRRASQVVGGKWVGRHACPPYAFCGQIQGASFLAPGYFSELKPFVNNHLHSCPPPPKERAANTGANPYWVSTCYYALFDSIVYSFLQNGPNSYYLLLLPVP
jgi:hypothetical protein